MGPIVCYLNLDRARYCLLFQLCYCLHRLAYMPLKINVGQVFLHLFTELLTATCFQAICGFPGFGL
jgi:hypothetical protein